MGLESEIGVFHLGVCVTGLRVIQTLSKNGINCGRGEQTIGINCCLCRILLSFWIFEAGSYVAQVPQT